MKLWDRVKLAGNVLRRSSPENPNTTFFEWLESLGGGPVLSGVTVNNSTALRISAVFACIRILAETIASLPLIVYERDADGGKTRATNHDLYRLLHDEPNPLMSSFIWRETKQGHVAGMGNAYSAIVRDGSGTVRELWPLDPVGVTPEVESGRLVYRLSDRVARNGEKILLPADVLHIPGLGYDGIRGYNPIHMARETMGLAIAAEQYGAALFGNKSEPGGVLETDQKLDDNIEKRLRAGWESAHRGPANAHRIAVLQGGLKWKPVAINPDDAQFLETRKFQINEIARLFRIPPHMIGDLERATFSNIEHQSLEFVTHTLRPWLVRWEMEINRKLFGKDERRQFFVEFNVEGLLRGDIKSRFESYGIAIQNGWLSRNEVRRLENMNPEEGLDEFLEPMNMQGASAAAEEAA